MPRCESTSSSRPFRVLIASGGLRRQEVEDVGVGQGVGCDVGEVGMG